MKVSKKNRALPLLVTAVIIVWGIIAYRVTDYYLLSDESGQEIIEEFDTGSSSPKSNMVSFEKDIKYESLSRNPFNFYVKPKPQQKPVIKLVQPEQPKEMIDFSINGVISNGGSSLAILEDKTNGTTQFLREGETYKMIKVLNITSGMVKVKIYDDVIEKAVN